VNHINQNSGGTGNIQAGNLIETGSFLQSLEIKTQPNRRTK